MAADDPATKWRAFPASYVSLARRGVRWIRIPVSEHSKNGYWFSVIRRKGEMVITGVFWDRANIPSRFTSPM
jgi:hypothetical protein